MRFRNPLKNRESIWYTTVHILAVLAAVIAVFPLLQANKFLVGPVVLGLGGMVLAMLWVSGRGPRTVAADMVYGAIDIGMLSSVVSITAIFVGPVGAIFGTIIADAMTDAIAGMFEGQVAEWLRRRGIEESRTAMSAGLGKMAGGLLAAGVIVTIVGVLIGSW